MKKIDFAKVPVKNVEGQTVYVNIQKEFGNILYMRGRHITEKDLGHKIYHSDGEIELDEQEVEVVKQWVKELFPIVIQEGVDICLS